MASTFLNRYLQLLVLLFVFTTKMTHAQFAMVDSKDELTPLLEAADGKSAVLATIKNGELVFLLENEAVNSYYLVGFKNDLAGYVKIEAIQPLQQHTAFSRVSETDQRLILKHAVGELTYTVAAVDLAKEKDHFTVERNIDQQSYVTHYHKAPFWGTDGDYPKEKIESIQLTWKNKLYSMPKALFQACFSPNLTATDCYYSKETETVYLTFTNGDGAGGYVGYFYFRNKQWAIGSLFNGF